MNKTMNLQDIQNDIADVYPEDADKVPLSVLKTMISELPETKKVIFCLYCIDGFSHRQISDRLGITENASSSMLSKAKRTLASKIKAYLKKEENHR